MLGRNAALAVTTPTEREIVIRRVLDAPRRLVFEAWTKPEHLARWFGKTDWTLAICEIDLRPGGAWRFVLRGPDGSDMGMRGVYQEIAPPERLVCTGSFDDYPGESFNTLSSSEEGRTTITCRITYPSKEVRDAVIRSGVEKGIAESYNRLVEHLGAMARGET
jgi:uncharacterized protein YndB with AHSA1/START domain